MDEYEWLPSPPTTTQRMIAGTMFIAFLALGANYLFGWRALDGYDKHALGLAIMVGVISVRYFPTVRRV